MKITVIISEDSWGYDDYESVKSVDVAGFTPAIVTATASDSRIFLKKASELAENVALQYILDTWNE